MMTMMMIKIIVVVVIIITIIIIIIIKVKIVKQFDDEVGMESGLEKCAKASFKKGKLTSTGKIVIDDDTEIQQLDQEGPGVCKYLGVD